MEQLIQWLLRFVLVSAGLYALWSAIIILREERGSDLVVQLTRIQVVKIRLAELLTIVVAFTIGSFIGYLYRDHQLSSNEVVYTDIVIRDKISEKEFKIQPARMSPIHSIICNESSVDWQQGEILCSLRFEQQQNCKRIISYDRENCVKGELSER